MEVKKHRDNTKIWQSEKHASQYILIMKDNDIHSFSKLFDNVLYMFRTGPLFIIRNISTLYTCNRYTASASMVILTMLADANRTSMTNTYCVYTVFRYS